MVHMDSSEPLAQAKFDKDMQQDDRVATAGKADAQALIASRLGREKRGNPGRETT